MLCVCMCVCGRGEPAYFVRCKNIARNEAPYLSGSVPLVLAFTTCMNTISRNSTSGTCTSRVSWSTVLLHM